MSKKKSLEEQPVKPRAKKPRAKVLRKVAQPRAQKAVPPPPVDEVPKITIQEFGDARPVTRSWRTVLSDGRVYKTTTTIMNRAVLVSSIAVYIVAFVIAGMSVFAANESLKPPPYPGSIDKNSVDQALVDAGAAAGYTGSGGEAFNIGIIAAKLLQFFFGALGLLFVGYIFYAGFQWLTAAGDEKKVASARGIIFHSIIGLLVCVASFSISSAWLSAIGSAVRP